METDERQAALGWPLAGIVFAVRNIESDAGRAFDVLVARVNPDPDADPPQVTKKVVGLIDESYGYGADLYINGKATGVERVSLREAMKAAIDHVVAEG